MTPQTQTETEDTAVILILNVWRPTIRNLEVWKQAFELNKKLHVILQSFPADERYALTDQMRRSGLSIASNIAEGSGRWSDSDYARFLHIAKGSCMELETQLLLSETFGYITSPTAQELLSIIDEINRMLFGMIKKR